MEVAVIEVTALTMGCPGAGTTHTGRMYIYSMMNSGDNKQSNTIQHNTTTPETTPFFPKHLCMFFFLLSVISTTIASLGSC